MAGEAPNLAARLQAVGPPGAVVVAESTRCLLGGLFALEDLGPKLLKGFPEPMRAWRVTGEGSVEGRFEALRGASVAPLVGRRQELALLLDRWGQAKEGEGHVVLVAGEAGIGKSRLVRALHNELAGDTHALLAHHCSPHHANTAPHPVIGFLERAAGLRREEPPDRQLARLEAALALSAGDSRDGALLLAELLGIPGAADRGELAGLSPQRRKERTFLVLLDQLAGLAARGPVLALYEDVHWADPSALEFLDRAADRVRRLRVLTVVTSRPGFVPPWSGHGHATALSLGRLGRRLGAALVERVAGGKALPAEVRDRILDRADGVPLYLEELTKAALASGLPRDHRAHQETAGLPPSEVAVPASLKDSLVAQLDRLDVVKQVIQADAVIGREFSFELLA